MNYVRVEVNGRVWLIPGDKMGELMDWLTTHAVDATIQDQKIREVVNNPKDPRHLICESH